MFLGMYALGYDTQVPKLVVWVIVGYVLWGTRVPKLVVWVMLGCVPGLGYRPEYIIKHAAERLVPRTLEELWSNRKRRGLLLAYRT